MYKLCFNAGLSCPNRDGTLGLGGCIFCSEGGSGEFSVDITRGAFQSTFRSTQENAEEVDITRTIREALNEAKGQVGAKFAGDEFIAYFQAFSNTYGPVEYLRRIYRAVMQCEEVKVLSIATRPDCLNEEVYELLEELVNIKPVWIELGLQTVKEESISFIRRGYSTDVYDEAVRRLNSIGIHVITHVILYLPGESVEDMKETVRHVCAAGSRGIKLQELMILKNTELGRMYEKGELDGKIHIPTKDEYIKTVGECVSILPPDMVVHRMSADPPRHMLIEPQWVWDKKKVMNALTGELRKRGLRK